MAGQTTITGKIVKSYLDKFPNVPSLTLAKKIYRENKEAFTDVESVRSGIRWYRGKCGARNLKELKDKAYTKQKTKLPEPVTERKETYQIPTKNNNILVISDLHIPYHDNEAIRVAINYGKKEKINTIIINGDLIDFYQLSRFEKDPKKRSAGHEIKEAKQFLEWLRFEFPRADIFWYLGNHDHRFNKYMLLKAPELLDIPEFSLYHIMDLQKYRVHLLDNNRGWRAGKLNGRHGHEFYGSGGVFPARSYYLKANDNILVSHVHFTSEFTIPDIRKNVRGGWSIGCLSDLDPDYNPTNRYNLGFARVRIFKDGNFSVNNLRIINGKAV
jgi:predicted phosphodiesterase